MDKKRGIINVVVSIICKIILLIANLIVRRFLIQFIGNEINGLNSLYISLLDFLAIAELGVGTAITFCMYKPIVDGNIDKVAALYRLFTKLYLIIGGIILVAGCLLMPILPFLAKDYRSIDVNLYYTFGLTLISVVLSYVFSSKTSLINAYKNNYITIIIASVGQLSQCVMQIIVLIYTRSYVWFLWCRIIACILQWVLTEIIVRKKHSEVLKNKQRIDNVTQIEVTKSIKAMFMHKIGGVLVNTADSIIISAFIGVVVLGKYSNYTTIVIAMSSVLYLCFTPLTSVIGHMCVEENKEQIQKYYKFFYTFNYILGLIFFLGYYAVIDNLVTICFGNNLEMQKSVSLVITANYFIQFMRRSTLLFRDATGTFYYDRWKPLIEGVLNIGLSIGFVYLFEYLWGAEFSVVGVIVATIVTNLTICHVIEPYVLYKHILRSDVRIYYIRNYLYIALFVGLLFALNFSMIQSDNQWVELFANGGISLAFSLTVSAIVVFLNKEFRHYAKSFLSRIKRSKANHTKMSVVASGVDNGQLMSDTDVLTKNEMNGSEDINVNTAADIKDVEIDQIKDSFDN